MAKNLDITLVRTFIAVAENASMTVAANALHLTQGAISQQIKRLEDAFEQQHRLRGAGGAQLVDAREHAGREGAEVDRMVERAIGARQAQPLLDAAATPDGLGVNAATWSGVWSRASVTPTTAAESGAESRRRRHRPPTAAATCRAVVPVGGSTTVAATRVHAASPCRSGPSAAALHSASGSSSRTADSRALAASGGGIGGAVLGLVCAFLGVRPRPYRARALVCLRGIHCPYRRFGSFVA